MKTHLKNILVCFVAVSFVAKHATSIPIMHQQTNSAFHHPPSKIHDYEFLTPPKLHSGGEVPSAPVGVMGRSEDDFNRDYHMNARNVPPKGPHYQPPVKANSGRRLKIVRNNIEQQLFQEPFTQPEAYVPVARTRKESLQPSRDNNKPKTLSPNSESQHSARGVADPESEFHSHPSHGGDHICISGICRSLPDPYFEQALPTEKQDSHSEKRRRPPNEEKRSPNHFEMPIIRQKSNNGPPYQPSPLKRDTHHIQKPLNIYSIQDIPPEAQPMRILENNSQNPNPLYRGHQPFKKVSDSVFIFKPSSMESKLTDFDNMKHFIQPGSSSNTGILLIMDISEAYDTYETKLETEEDNSLSP
ncbi:unnamed protein product [Allacma fusca]|uniref:Uncharacterized protein n=1 Tax=Allacma fusca TaxID=39272 RepID=A0A8J2K4B9_9HEXA|nr:unnamed protein product [Allacma fusca]